MNSKAPLALMGQLLMVLFFSLAAAICLQAFAKSEALSIASENRDHAALYAQNAAETLKSTHGDLDRASAILGGSVGADGVWSFGYDVDWNESADGVFSMTVQKTDDESVPGLGTAAVTVTDRDGRELFRLTCAWQEAIE